MVPRLAERCQAQTPASKLLEPFWVLWFESSMECVVVKAWA